MLFCLMISDIGTDESSSLSRTYTQGRSKRSGWSGHGRTNNRAGKFYFFNFLYFFIIFFGRNNNRAGNFSILFLKQRRHSRQNVHSDDSILGRFRPSHVIASRQSSSFDGWERPPGARVRWPLQRPSMRRREYHGGSVHMCSSDWTYFWTSFADSATSFADSVTSFADSVTMELVGLQRPSMRRRDYHGGSYICVLRLNLLLNKFRRQCYKFRRQCYKFRRQCYDGVGWPTATLNSTQGLSRR